MTQRGARCGPRSVMFWTRRYRASSYALLGKSDRLGRGRPTGGPLLGAVLVLICEALDGLAAYSGEVFVEIGEDAPWWLPGGGGDVVDHELLKVVAPVVLPYT